MKTVWHCYDISPIDFNWEYLPTVKDTLCSLIQTPMQWETACGEDVNEDWAASFVDSWKFAKETARQRLHWDEEFNGHPRVIWIPDDNAFGFGFVFKQGNNGNTYVFSPQPMAWLFPLASEYVRVEQA